MHKLTFVILLIAANLAYGEPSHRCAAAATKQAQRLLGFHAGPDDRIEIDKNVKVLGPMRNPHNKSQTFDVLEIWGYIYKGQYRMHFIYAQVPGDCLLMGQEIIEFASL